MAGQLRWGAQLQVGPHSVQQLSFLLSLQSQGFPAPAKSLLCTCPIPARLFFLYLVTQGICIAWGLRIYLSGYRGISSIRRTAPAMSRARSALDLWVEEHLPLLAGTGALVVFGVFIVSLLGYHTYLVATNQTTYELVKQASASGF